MATTTPGIDVSHYQGAVDWGKVKSAGMAFAFAKATEGTSVSDSMFAVNWPGIKNAGLVRGAYHFFHASKDATDQANYFLDAVQSAGGFLPGDLPPVIDFENSSLDGLSNPAVQSGVSAWLQAVASKTGVTPMIYTAHSVGNQYLAGQFGSYPLWIANYGVVSPSLPQGWTNWQFWQYSQSGSVSGIAGNVDMDYFNGTPDQLAASFNSPGMSAENSPSASASLQTYTVQPGDTLSAIAVRFGVTVSALASVNGIQDPNVIQAGQVLQIPS
jgi:lysozyme